LFQLLDRLTHARSGDQQTFGGAPEVQLVGERQEDLDLAPFHGPPSCKPFV
jgi:hypothetical protein